MTNEERTQLEEQILHILLKHRDAILDFTSSPLKAKQFHPANQLLLNAVLDADEKNVTLTHRSFTAYVETCGRNKLESVAEGTKFAKVSNLAGVSRNDLPTLIDKMRQGVVQQRTLELLEGYRRSSQNDAIYAATDLVEQMRATLDDVKTNTTVTFDVIEDRSFTNAWRADLERKANSEEPVITCGIPEIDEVMGVGFHPETLTVICADVGGYKSTMMLNIALGIYKKNKVDVLFVPLEMPKFRVFDKIISRETGIPFYKFQKPRELKEEDKIKIENKIAEWDGSPHHFALLEVGERTTVSLIRRQIEKHLTHHNPAVVVIDYVANLLPDRRHQGRNDLEIGDMLKNMVKMGRPGSVTPSGFAVVTGAQLNRSALTRLRQGRGEQNRALLASEDIHGSHQYAADATSIFGLIKDTANPSQLTIVPIKNRYGKTVYNNGSAKGTLKVMPEISFITSGANATWQSDEDDGILKKFVSDTPSLPTDTLDFDFADTFEEATEGLDG